MKEILDFLTELKLHNDRLWFDTHKSRYVAVNASFNELVEQLIARIAAFDSHIAPLTVKDCTYRIYRDTRFSKNKTPYKTHMGAYIARGGKNSSYAGYYFHLEPATKSEDGFLGGPLLACGLYCPEPNVLKSIREDLFAQGALYQKALKAAPGFVLDTSRSLKRTPKGFPIDSPWDDYLKLKEFSAMKPISYKDILAPDAIEKSVNEFKKVKSLNDLLNRAVDFAFTESEGL